MPAHSPFAVSESFDTKLSPLDEMAFRQWVQKNKVRFNPDAPVSDYDMRGLYRGLTQGNPMASSGVNPNDNLVHYSDYYKTPSHQSFSGESQWSAPGGPQWINDHQLATTGGQIIFDEKAPEFLPTEKKHGGPVMPLINSASPSAFTRNLKTELGARKPKNQALAIAYRVQRDHMAAGGGVPFTVRAEAKGLEHAGMIHSPIAGRTDRLPMSVKPGAYVVPADVVSGIGQGNSLSGANALSQLFKMGPGGMHMSRVSGGGMRKHFADGGGADGDEPVDIVAAGGEMVIPPSAVQEIGGGDIKHGHDILDAFVSHVRKKTIKTLRKLPKPKKK